jgi:hypothetical protein
MSRALLALLFSTVSTLAFAAPGDTPFPPPIPQAGAATNSGGTPGGTSGQLQYNNSGAFGGVTVSGDGTLNTSTGALTVTKTGGTAFGALATVTPGTGVATALTDATGSAGGFPVLATGGYLAAAQFPAMTGDVTNTAGALATTVGSIGGKSVTLGAGLTTTGAGAATLAFGASTQTYTFPSATATLAQLGAQTFTGAQTFPASGIILDGSSTGATTLTSANASATNYTLTLPAANDTVVTLAATQTLTNKSIAATQLTGALQAAQEPAHTGDMTNSAGSLATTVLSTNGTAFGALATATPGAGVASALAVAVGSAGAVVVNGGALGTPSSGTLTNATGLPIATGVSGLGTGVASALTSSIGGSSGVLVNNNVNSSSTTIQETGTQVQLVLQRADTSLGANTDVAQLRGQGYDDAGTPVLQTWGDMQFEAVAVTGTTGNEGEVIIAVNSGSALESSAIFTPTTITFYTNTLGGGAGVAAMSINSSQNVNFAGPITVSTLQSGTASTYACWTAGKALISSSSAC